MTTMTTSTPKKPKHTTTLKGVAFEMDGTLVRSNPNPSDVYRMVFERDPPEGYDLLREIECIESSEEKSRAYEILNDTESASRRKMTLTPGCEELLTFLSLQKISTAIVTRKSHETTEVLSHKLKQVEANVQDWGQDKPPDLSFKRIIARDDRDADNNPIPPKPDPSAIQILARETFGCETSQVLVVGDSVANDVGFGKNAGAKTALFVKSDDDSSTVREDAADLSARRLTDLPKQLWKNYFIDGPLGNTPENDYGQFHRSPAPKPQSELCKAVADGDPDLVRTLLGNMTIDEITTPDPNGNTALIWAAETGNVAIARLLVDDVVEKSIPTFDIQKRMANFQNRRGYLGATALNRAARRNHTEFLEFLIREGDRFDMNLPNDKMQYPLHFCAFKKNPEALEYLLMCGANPWVLDRKGRTPLDDSTCETCSNLLRSAMAGDCQ